MPIISGGSTGGALSGVTISGTAAASQVPVATNASTGAWKYPPGFEIGYDQVTAGANIVSLTEATPTTVIACAAHVFDGTAVLLNVFIPQIASPAVLSGFVIVVLFEGATQIGRLGIILTSAAAAAQEVFSASYRFTPTAASHTYTVGAYCSSTTGTPAFTAGAGGTGAAVPAFARFTKV